VAPNGHALFPIASFMYSESAFIYLMFQTIIPN
jgi:hypothetical protein